MMTASMPQSSGNEPRSVSVSQSEAPDRKKQKKEKKEEEKRKRAAAEAEAKKKAEDERKKKEAEDFRRQLQSESDLILYGCLFNETYRCETQESLRKQAEYEKKLVFSVLERTPNYRWRVQEGEDWNRREMEMRAERMRVARERQDNPVQDAAAEAERVRKEAEGSKEIERESRSQDRAQPKRRKRSAKRRSAERRKKRSQRRKRRKSE